VDLRSRQPTTDYFNRGCFACSTVSVFACSAVRSFARQGLSTFAAQGLSVFAAQAFKVFAAHGFNVLAAQGLIVFAAQGLIVFAAQGLITFAAQGLISTFCPATADPTNNKGRIMLTRIATPFVIVRIGFFLLSFDLSSLTVSSSIPPGY
jgi:hypothetical protein